MVMDFRIDTREELLKSLRGRTLSVPDLQALLSKWPQDINPELDRLRKDVDEMLQECVLSNCTLWLSLLANLPTYKGSFPKVKGFAK